MQLRPITIDVDSSLPDYDNDFCREMFTYYPSYYDKVGYTLPWIGYWVYNDEDIIVGVGGFTGAPKDNKIELAYGTRKEYEGKGISTFTCSELLSIARQTDKNLTITAKTSPEENASTTILKRNGFVFTGIVQDDDIGDAWEWTWNKTNDQKA